VAIWICSHSFLLSLGLFQVFFGRELFQSEILSEDFSFIPCHHFSYLSFNHPQKFLQHFDVAFSLLQKVSIANMVMEYSSLGRQPSLRSILKFSNQRRFLPFSHKWFVRRGLFGGFGGTGVPFKQSSLSIASLWLVQQSERRPEARLNPGLLVTGSCWGNRGFMPSENHRLLFTAYPLFLITFLYVSLLAFSAFPLCNWKWFHGQCSFTRFVYFTSPSLFKTTLFTNEIKNCPGPIIQHSLVRLWCHPV
jgi:hypothetical protein